MIKACLAVPYDQDGAITGRDCGSGVGKRQNRWGIYEYHIEAGSQLLQQLTHSPRAKQLPWIGCWRATSQNGELIVTPVLHCFA
jgi:hypothetical protein